MQAPAAEGAALGDEHALGAAVGDDHLGGDGMGLVLEVDHRVLGRSTHAAEQQLAVAADELGRPAGSRLNRSTRRSSSGNTLYLRLQQEQPLQLMELVGLGGGRSWAWVQSVLVSYSSQTSSSKAGSLAPNSHRCWRVTAVQPLW